MAATFQCRVAQLFTVDSDTLYFSAISLYFMPLQ
nr:MAG TPA: hypothetical protein [Caudoviricetes sp.]